MRPEKDNLDVFILNLMNVLEQMAFVSVERDQDFMESGVPEESLLAEMSFSGKYSGSVRLAAPLELCREIAVNMLGTESEDLSAAMLRDALREVLNMSCGQFLTESYGTDLVFNLTVPDVTGLDEEGWETISSSPGFCRLTTEEHPLLVKVEMH